MKKKILSICLVAVIAVMAITGASLAYLTDTDEADNVFVVGNVDIDLLEQQRDGEGGLEDFENDKVLLPIVGSAQGEKDSLGLPVAENYVDKIVNVKNTGKTDAFVRVVFAFPANMDDAKSAAEMMLHWNYDGSEKAGNWTREDNGAKVTIENVEYNLYTYTYNPILATGETTDSPAITGVYIDSRVDAAADKDGNITYFMKNSRGEEVSATFAKETGPQIYVVAQAVQAKGFDTVGAKAALNEAFGEITAINNPWAE